VRRQRRDLNMLATEYRPICATGAGLEILRVIMEGEEQARAKQVKGSKKIRAQGRKNAPWDKVDWWMNPARR